MNESSDAVDPLRLVEDVAIRHHRVTHIGHPFAVVLGSDDLTAIVSAPVVDAGGRREGWEMAGGGALGEGPDARLLAAVQAVADGITAVAWALPDVGGQGVEIRSEECSGRARRTWPTDPSQNAWDREDSPPVLWPMTTE